ncbi:MAG: AtpZ/AtpI family protein [Rickettsiales bacterium]|nr:AtpZ/AtpI family protein [Rickettsiales bacterium]
MTQENQNLQDKIKNLSDKIDATKTPEKEIIQPSNLSFAFKISAELIAGITIGAFAGYYFDKFFQTKPLFLIIFLLLGVAGSLLNLYRDIKNG